MRIGPFVWVPSFWGQSGVCCLIRSPTFSYRRTTKQREAASGYLTFILGSFLKPYKFNKLNSVCICLWQNKKAPRNGDSCYRLPAPLCSAVKCAIHQRVTGSIFICHIRLRLMPADARLIKDSPPPPPPAAAATAASPWEPRNCDSRLSLTGIFSFHEFAIYTSECFVSISLFPKCIVPIFCLTNLYQLLLISSYNSLFYYFWPCLFSSSPSIPVGAGGQ